MRTKWTKAVLASGVALGVMGGSALAQREPIGWGEPQVEPSPAPQPMPDDPQPAPTEPDPVVPVEPSTAALDAAVDAWIADGSSFGGVVFQWLPRRGCAPGGTGYDTNDALRIIAFVFAHRFAERSLDASSNDDVMALIMEDGRLLETFQQLSWTGTLRTSLSEDATATLHHASLLRLAAGCSSFEIDRDQLISSFIDRIAIPQGVPNGAPVNVDGRLAWPLGIRPFKYCAWTPPNASIVTFTLTTSGGHRFWTRGTPCREGTSIVERFHFPEFMIPTWQCDLMTATVRAQLDPGYGNCWQGMTAPVNSPSGALRCGRLVDLPDPTRPCWPLRPNKVFMNPTRGSSVITVAAPPGWHITLGSPGFRCGGSFQSVVPSTGGNADFFVSGSFDVWGFEGGACSQTGIGAGRATVTTNCEVGVFITLGSGTKHRVFGRVGPDSQGRACVGEYRVVAEGCAPSGTCGNADCRWISVPVNRATGQFTLWLPPPGPWNVRLERRVSASLWQPVRHLSLPTTAINGQTLWSHAGCP